MKNPRFLPALLLTLFLPAAAQVAKEANKEYQSPADRERIIQRLENTDRVERLKLKELIPLLGIRPGSTVADVATGTGIMLPFLVEAVGPSGRVVAEDIQQQFLDKAQEKVKANGWSNVTLTLGADRNPNLPAGQLDLVFILDAFHHFDYPGEMLDHIARSLKPGGRLAIMEIYQKRRGSKDEDMSKHVRADKDQFTKEIEGFGWRLLSQNDHATNQYLLIFSKK